MVKRCTLQSTKPFIQFTENVNVTMLYQSALVAPPRLDSGPGSIAAKLQEGVTTDRTARNFVNVLIVPINI